MRKRKKKVYRSWTQKCLKIFVISFIFIFFFCLPSIFFCCLAIFLSQFKGSSYEELAKGLQNLNSKMFTQDHIKAIMQTLPSKDDVCEYKIFWV